MNRHFHVGDVGDIAGVRWRVVQGKKAPEDLRLDLCAPRFVPVSMGVGFLLADFLCENEEYLYPRAKGFSGGDRYMRFVDGTRLLGWEAAYEQLKQER